MRRRRRRNSWRGHRKAHARAARLGWRHRKHSRRSSRRYGKRRGHRGTGKKYVRLGGKKLGWKALVRRKGVKGAVKLWRRAKRRSFRRK